MREARHLFVEQRDGIESAIDFSRQTMISYRRALLTTSRRGAKVPHFATQKEYRRSFIESYLVFKQYVLEKEE